MNRRFRGLYGASPSGYLLLTLLDFPNGKTLQGSPEMTHTYTNRSNAVRAATKALGKGNFEIVGQDGEFAYEPKADVTAERRAGVDEPDLDKVAPVLTEEPVAADVRAWAEDEARRIVGQTNGAAKPVDTLIDDALKMGQDRAAQEREGAERDALEMGEQAADKETARAAVRKMEKLKMTPSPELLEKAGLGEKDSSGKRVKVPAKTPGKTKGGAPRNVRADAIKELAGGEKIKSLTIHSTSDRVGPYQAKADQMFKLAKAGDVKAIKAINVPGQTGWSLMLNNYRDALLARLR
jgi:hypothetical protein